MKKFMFAAIAALVMVSVSNVFASNRMVSNAEVAPVDTVAPDAPSDTTEVARSEEKLFCHLEASAAEGCSDTEKRRYCKY